VTTGSSTDSGHAVERDCAILAVGVSSVAANRPARTARLDVQRR